MAFGVGNTPWLEGPKSRFVQYTNPETNIAPDGWNTSFLLDGLFFRCDLLVSGSVNIILPQNVFEVPLVMMTWDSQKMKLQ